MKTLGFVLFAALTLAPLSARANLGGAVEVDTDHDGIADSAEAAPTDSDRDGLPDWLDLDSDGDGVSDAVEAGDNDLATAPIDTDGDGLPDFIDRDSDNDGLLDAVEDSDGDGVTEPSETSRTLADTDGDTVLDGDEDRDHNGHRAAGEIDPRDPDTDRDAVRDDQDPCPLVADDATAANRLPLDGCPGGTAPPLGGDGPLRDTMSVDVWITPPATPPDGTTVAPPSTLTVRDAEGTIVGQPDDVLPENDPNYYAQGGRGCEVTAGQGNSTAGTMLVLLLLVGLAYGWSRCRRRLVTRVRSS